MTDQFENKRFVTMFFTTKESPLAYSDLLVYCYRAHQDCYGENPSHRRVAKRTGIKEETVAAASKRLRECGLLDMDGSVSSPCPCLDWFHPLDSLLKKHEREHFSKWLWNWRCYIRQPGPENPLTVPAVMLYSLIRHSVIGGWKPKDGWSYEYLSVVLGLTATTVSNALLKLEQLGFLTKFDGMRFRLYKLQAGQLRCFSDNRPYSGSSSVEPDEIVDELSPFAKMLEEQENARFELIQYLKRWPISEKEKHSIYHRVQRTEGWPKGWERVAAEMIDKVLP
jgi:DNA-binding Lrp family transcriptional regulator